MGVVVLNFLTSFDSSHSSKRKAFVCIMILLIAIAYSESFALFSFFSLFLFTFTTCLFFFFPESLLSPLVLFYAYYGVWYLWAPLFAGRYVGTVGTVEYQKAYFLVSMTFATGVWALVCGEKFFQKKQAGFLWLKSLVLKVYSRLTIKNIVFILYCMATVCIFLIVLSSGGFEVWLQDPGKAFLNRAGSGVYVVLSHFFSICLAVATGYYAYSNKKLSIMLWFAGWLFLTAPVHGSKSHILLLIILHCIPWLKSASLLGWQSFSMCLLGGAVFVGGMVIRGGKLSNILSFLNYFSALENLAISIRDFKPDFLKTFFLPFVKFKTPFGLSAPNMYYDMNHMLTDIYYPAAWAIRSTEQWPVETDLYLNFYFYLGLPLLFAYLFIVGWFYGNAKRQNTVGAWAASALMTVFMITHLRGSLINHIDFYFYPFIGIVFFFFSPLLYERAQR